MKLIKKFIKEKLDVLLRRKEYVWNSRVIHHRGSGADLGVIDQILNKKDYDLTRFARNNEIQDFYKSCKKPLIIDAGANIGVSVNWFSHVFPNSKIIAIEPEK